MRVVCASAQPSATRITPASSYFCGGVLAKVQGVGPKVLLSHVPQEVDSSANKNNYGLYGVLDGSTAGVTWTADRVLGREAWAFISAFATEKTSVPLLCSALRAGTAAVEGS